MREADNTIHEQPGEDAFTVRLGDCAVTVPARCPHRGAPLAQGVITGTFLECPWHGATFDLRTGKRLRGPQCADLGIAGTVTGESGKRVAPHRSDHRDVQGHRL
ncbi:nitrite reductase/ring-hydroxylating ferredoxin subunit [Streptomyces olivoverticillatus]|uniref:Nitrite reductase/ring-hydroxylating ferredoxin subunit n=1 Tax=Streptomyces olivoverticillatus TaxID=66427 RepID=A0A7W7PMC9_9ACTN|nr:Rieske (2Fe-2S) protein [Streptomyces olivoverticillatus]MBB4893660.1 nitrite reductase/ring-hydroxylating ferredoxin subunit [Streptomyces olivoverticillatus]